MKNRIVVIALVLFGTVFFAGTTLAQETDLLATVEAAAEPAFDLGNLLKQAGGWIIRNGEIACFYDCIGDDKGSETIAKLTLFDLFDIVNVDIAATIPLETLDEAPGLGGGLGVSLGAVLDKCGVEWDKKWDVSIGGLGGYDFGDKDWMLGPTIAVRALF